MIACYPACFELYGMLVKMCALERDLASKLDHCRGTKLSGRFASCSSSAYVLLESLFSDSHGAPYGTVGIP